MYSNMYRNYELPGQAYSSGSQNWWWGANTLGAAMGLKVTDPSSPDYQGVVDRIAKILHCPANERGKNPALTFSVDYVYNDNMGDYRGIVSPSDSAYKSGLAVWGQFKKRNQVPDNVLLAVDAANNFPQYQNNGAANSDDRFDHLGGLTWKYGDGGSPHGTGPVSNRKGNALFHDGTVRLVRVFSPPVPSATLPYSTPSYTSPAYENTVNPYTDLRDWMICDPGHSTSAATDTVPLNECWQRGRPLPF